LECNPLKEMMKVKRLLIIDDDLAFARFVARVATSVGCDVEITTRGEDFMAAVLRAPPDVIVLDISMPKIDGIELIGWLSEQQVKARIIVMTGFGRVYAQMAENIGRANELSSIIALGKPIRVEDLTSALRNVDTI
jgi:DNA-binding response OmpR family regulator